MVRARRARRAGPDAGSPGSLPKVASMSTLRPLARRALLAAPVLLLVTPAAAAQRPAPPPPGADSAAMRMEMGARMTRTLRTGAAALAAFRPAVAPVDSGGECLVRAEQRPGVRAISAYYPARRDARSVVTVTVDSAGTLLRYSERRGGVSFSLAGATTEEERAARRAEFQRQPTTTISLDLVTGTAIVSNDGGDSVGAAVRAPVDAVLESAALGRPAERARAVQARCGGPVLRVASTTSDSVSAAVVAALYMSGPPEWLRLRAGEAAPELPGRAIPPDAELLGSGMVQGRSTTAVLVPYAADSARRVVEARLLAAGWTRPPAPPGANFGARGFVSTDQASYLPQQGLCGTGTHLTYTTSRWSDGRTLLRLVLASLPSGGYSVCNPPSAQRAMMGGGANDSIVPELQPPPGIAVHPAGGVGGGTRWEYRGVAVQRVAVAELLRHYGTQLRTAGWELVEEAPGKVLAMQLWQRRVASGANAGLWHTTFTVQEQPGGQRLALYLRVEREERQ